MIYTFQMREETFTQWLTEGVKVTRVVQRKALTPGGMLVVRR